MWTPSPLPGTQSGLGCRMQFLCGKKNVKSLFSSPDYDFANQIRLGTKAWEGALENVDFASGWAEQSGKFWSCACSGIVERGEKGRPPMELASEWELREENMPKAALLCFPALFRINEPRVPKVFWRKGDKHSNSSDKIRMRNGVTQCADPWADPTP